MVVVEGSLFSQNRRIGGDEIGPKFRRLSSFDSKPMRICLSRSIWTCLESWNLLEDACRGTS
ncbi:predicted protein [Arabidopsis lyrata subsp. lyrata]|uniref:Predicted protein n=1 Tax=Arabidopsis lyrata subsp. lyrata TaxID=81972 RepID=D7LL25_ARALL|nr:predicted protein [Arabidopsis lyrata subsp. lyrata]